MGTRHVILIRNEKGDLKLAQYGQWDGDPAGQGAIVLDFLKKVRITPVRKAHFLKQLDKLYFLSEKDVMDFHNCLNRMKDSREAAAIRAQHPEMSRDTSAGIHQFLGEFDCEWAYEINFKTNEFIVYRASRRPFKTYSLDKLPTPRRLVLDCNDLD
jgi:hypothetical protein